VVNWSGTSNDVRGDLNLDGYVDAGDEAQVSVSAQVCGRGQLGSTAIRNSRGYLGLQGDAGSFDGLWLGRMRIHSAALG